MAVADLSKARAEQLAREVMHLEAVLGKKKDELKTLVKTLGPVKVDGVVWGFSPKVSWSLEDPDLFVAGLEAAGLRPYAFLGFGANEAKRLLKVMREDQILALGVKKKISSAFGKQKAGAEAEGGEIDA